MPAIAMTDHGNVFGAYEFYKMAKAAGVKPIIGIEAYAAPNISRFERKGVNFYGGGPDDVSARGAYTHMTLLSETTEGMHNLFRLSTGAWRDGFFKQPRMDRELLAQHSAGHDRHDRLPVRRGAGPPAPRQLRRGPAGRRRLPGHPRPGQLLPRADGPRPRHRDAGPRRAAPAGQGPADPAAGHQRLPLRHARGRAQPGAPALHQLRLDDGHPGRRRPGPAVRLQRRRLLPQVRGRDARDLARAARGLRQHPADRRALQRRVHRGQRHLHAALPVSRGAHRGDLAHRRGRARAGPALPRRRHRGGPRPGELRDRRHPQDGLPGLLPGGRRLHQLGQAAGHPGRARARLRCRLDGRLRPAHHRPRPDPARPAVRAVPQPRAHLDARLRHRLRRASARRGDPLRHREVRRGPGGDDRHLRHHQGQAGGQGLQPDPRLPVRDGRPGHQGDAGRGDGQGRPAQGDLQPRAQALRRGRGVPRPLRERCRRQAGRRHRARDRGAQAPVGRARRGRDHVQRAAGRRDPAAQAARRRRDDHPVRLPDL